MPNNNNIPTAQEFLKQDPMFEIESLESYEYIWRAVKENMVDFAKMHVENAIRAIEKKGLYDITTWSGNPFTGEGSDYLDVDKMLKAYPLDNIK